MILGFKNPGIECLLTKWHHEMHLRRVARIITLGPQNMARLLGGSLGYPSVIIIASTYMSRQWSTSTDRLVCLIWPKGTSETGRKELKMEERFANAYHCLETWDNSDSITAVNAQKDLRNPAKWWHNHSIITELRI